ncbi:E3 ubiquitin-protein ligase ATL6-like protein [Carex littledalei]|uniref:RING-type E3 ubiquitin transferase n=1 Tax=Carex littledalei TaxID=544730 RepID=A0A833VT43_9POAL|nr:E3 ubiquitin-protein ligase ATL6-like protein [Carex littledalei]
MWRSNGHPVAISRERNSFGLMLVFLLVILSLAIEAQSSPPSTNDNDSLYNLIGIIIDFICVFFFLWCISKCCSPQRGLDAAVLETFPIMVYSEVKEHQIGKGSVECAVCLCEFQDDENIRLLPKCIHMFHPDCIDEWLLSHVTCPLCRCILTPNLNQQSEQTEGVESSSLTRADETHNPSNQPDSVVVIDVDEHEDEKRRRQEAIELERIGSQKRALRAKSVRPDVGSVNKFNPRLAIADHIRKEIIAPGQARQARSLHSFPGQGEASSRRGYREGSKIQMGRSIRFGSSDRWPSFITRTFSTKAQSWMTNKRGDWEGSFGEGRINQR